MPTLIEWLHFSLLSISLISLFFLVLFGFDFTPSKFVGHFIIDNVHSYSHVYGGNIRYSRHKRTYIYISVRRPLLAVIVIASINTVTAAAALLSEKVIFHFLWFMRKRKLNWSMVQHLIPIDSQFVPNHSCCVWLHKLRVRKTIDSSLSITPSLLASPLSSSSCAPPRNTRRARKNTVQNQIVGTIY